MKKKELKKLAQTIAQCELLIAEGIASESEIEKAKETIMNISKRTSVMDMFLIDELVQEILNK
jgi:hypothetical protein